MFGKKKQLEGIKENYEHWCGFIFPLIHIKGFFTGQSNSLDLHIKNYHTITSQKKGLYNTDYDVCLEYKKLKKLEKYPANDISMIDIEDFELVD